MNMLKRYLAMFLVLCMLLSVVPFSAFAAEGTDQSGEETSTTVDVPESGNGAVEGETPDDESTGGEITEGEITEGETTEGVTPGDETSEGASAEGDAPVEEVVVDVITGEAENEVAIAPLDVTEYSLTYADEYRILHLDCGRKYFTKDWIIALINEMAAAGYTHLELAFGNDGLRFLLDDMSVGSYTDDAVTAAIKAGNIAYYNAGDVNELTQSDMDAIIAHAKSVGIGIIPLLNNPGHMNAIVSAINSLTGTTVGFDGSGSTIDLENEAAVAFTQELIRKYITYFAGKGCNEFNMGADEYANDKYSAGSMGFGALVTQNKYQLYVNYVNNMADMIKSAGMVPMAFNDGIYFNQNTSYVFDTQIMVTFWTSGWTGYQSASASTMRSKGHEMINVHGDYYYVLGKSDNWDSNTYTYASNWSNTAFMGSTVSDPKGSMFCIWCDYPGAETETQIAANTRLILRAMAAEMQDKDAASINTDVVDGGFNADGTIAETCEKVTVTDEDTGISITGCELSSVTVEEAEAPVIEGAAKVQAWDITPYVDGVAYTEKGTVKLPVPAGWNTSLLTGFYVENGAAVLVEGTYADGYYTFDMPHFSVGGVAELAEVEEEYTSEQDITVNIGESKTITDATGNYESTYTGAGLNTSVATVKVKGTTDEGKTTVTALTSLTAGTANTFYIQVSDGVYLTADVGTTTNLSEAGLWYAGLWYAYGVFPSYCTIRSSSTGYYLGVDWDGTVYTSQSTLYMRMSNGKLQGYYSYVDAGTPVTVTATDPVDATDITITGVSEGTTSVVVGNTKYNITVQYKEVELNVVVNGSKSDTQSATITGEPSYSIEGIVTATVSGDTVTFTAGETIGTTVVTVGNTKYTVNVIEVDLTSVDPLKLEYWITNGKVTDPGTNLTYIEISAAQSGIYSTEGVAVTDLVPDGLQREGRNVEYWQTKLLDVTVSNDSTSGTQEQTLLQGDDETLNDLSFTRVRYWNGAWQVLVGTTWTDVNRTEVTVKTYSNQEETGTATRETHQLVVYYMEVIDIANTNGETELHVNAADWGFKSGDNWGYSTSQFGACTISFQIVYEDNTTNPADNSVTALLSKTLVYDEWNERGIGTVIFNGEGDYQIYKVTAETGDADYTNNSNGFTINNLTWDNNEETVWSGNPTDVVPIGNNARKPSYDGIYSNLVWHMNDKEDNPANDAILIRVYVKAKATEDTLNVHYLDKTANNLEFYNYAINVNEGTVFANGFAMGTSKNTLVNNTVLNSNGVTQTVSADLATMPQIKAYYRYCNYTLTEVVRSSSGKDVYLYYEFTPVVSFVADFGLPIEITPTDLNQDGYATEAGDIKAVKVIGTYDTEAGSTAHAEYGTLSVDGTTVTYTPTSVLQGVDFFTIYVVTKLDDVNTTENDEAGIAYRVYVFPATTVYYEESFINFDSNWTGVNQAITVGPQTTEKLGAKENNYGYDDAYDGSSKGSNGTCASTSKLSATGTFTFTGTGFELYANCDTDSGYVSVLNQGGKVVKLYAIDTATGGDGAPTAGQTGKFYSLPVVSVKDLDHGTYTVKVIKSHDGDEIQIDGFRVINTVKDSTVFSSDWEDNPEFYQLRDYVLKAMNVGDSKQYGSIDEMVDQVYAGISTDTEAPSAAILANGIYDDDVQDLLDNGPKNEVYLYEGQTLVFNVKTSRALQIGLKAPRGAATYSVEYEVDGKTTTVKDEVTLSSSVDMFYALNNATGTEETYTITITNNGTEILSVTDLKICDDPNAAFVPLTENDIKYALTGEYDLDEDNTDTETPGENDPETSTPDKDEPETPAPDKDEPETSIPGENKPGENKPEENKPETSTPDKDESEETAPEKVPMYRLYNPYTQEHLLTASEAEKDQLLSIGWKLDGIAWNSPKSGKPVYRLYNPFDDWHTYTMSQEEIDTLVPLGWQVDGAVCFSVPAKAVKPIYRLFNPYEQTNYHLLTASVEESEYLVNLGWKMEGVAWYAMAD